MRGESSTIPQESGIERRSEAEAPRKGEPQDAANQRGNIPPLFKGFLLPSLECFMNIFIYDGTFEGLLSVVFDAYTLRSFPDRLYTAGAVLPLTAVNSHVVLTEAEKVGRVFAGLRKRLSEDGLINFMRVWLSEEEGSDELLFRFMCKVFDAKRSIERDMGDPDVLALVKISVGVRREMEKLMGFVRFQKTRQGVYFAAVEPRYNTVPLLLKHFADRFADQEWIIYDMRRHYGIMHKAGSLEEIFLDEGQVRDGALNAGLLAEGEELLQTLWKQYHVSIAVKERGNLRLQRQFMPKRFWRYLTEKQ